MSDAFKRMEIHDLFSPDKIAVFERPHEDNDAIVISQNFPGDFHIDADTLQIVAGVMKGN